ncbi:hypothetical protein LTR10_010571 [Elasticomyces elasticus]|nr:hypothetical protein LTR10_010571 [Elasticomyces elasticus]KAK4972470.1 hypothetical protein LTR42_006980 [Elasticomyces elasticus]
MAPSKIEEAGRLRNDALREILRYTDANLGLWSTPFQQTTALQNVIDSYNPKRKMTTGKKAIVPHDVASLRGLLTRAVNKIQNQKAPEPEEDQKTVDDFFRLGSSIFRDDFLEDIEFEAENPEQITGGDVGKSASEAGKVQLDVGTGFKLDRKRKSKAPARETDDSDVEELSPDEFANGPPRLKKPRLGEKAGEDLDATKPLMASQDTPMADYISAPPEKSLVRDELAVDSMVESSRTAKTQKLGMGAGQKRNGRAAFGDDGDAPFGSVEAGEEARKAKRSKAASMVAKASNPAVVETIDLEETVERQPASHSVVGQAGSRAPGSTMAPPTTISAMPGENHSRPASTVAHDHVQPEVMTELGAAKITNPPSDLSGPSKENKAGEDDDAQVQGKKHNVWGTPRTDGTTYFHMKGPRQVPAETMPDIDAESFTMLGQIRVYETMEDLHQHSEQFVLSWCRAHGHDGDYADAVFLNKPTPELRKLYEKVMGATDWQLQLLDFQNRDEPVKLRASEVGVALVNAAIYEQVFLKSTPWDIASQFAESIGNSRKKYFDEAMVMRGYEWETTLKHVAWLQAFDKNFQEGDMKNHANKLAHETAMVLLPHLQAMTAKPGAAPKHQPNWLRSIELAFHKALMMKSKLDAAADATFEYTWLGPDVPFLRADMIPASAGSEHGPTIHTLVPGVRMRANDETSWECQPRVWTQFAKKAGGGAPGQSATAG